MKYVKCHPDKCGYKLVCMATCAKKVQKSDDPALANIVITKKDDGTIDMNVCNQCGQCIDVCPTGALYRNKPGVVRINKDICVGCYTCVGFCPTGSMRTHESRTVPFKCISCGNCVKACPNKALAHEEGEFEPSYFEKGEPGEPGETFPKEYF
ncbi:MAG: 4Fe-4S dicluster domain-containing protein [Planctomycetota bacterium]|nr:MAG: 4Fe-4S dicluster domain-containing protein [Planctomycetota bacterium]